MAKKRRIRKADQYKKKRMKQAESCIEQIKEIELEVIPVTGTLVEYRYRQGAQAIHIRRLIDDDREFERFIAKHLPEVSYRSIQRYMQISEHVDIDKYPALCNLGTTLLLKLMTNKKDKNVVRILRKKKVRIPEKSASAEELKKFRIAVDKITEEKSRKKKPAGKNKGQKDSTTSKNGNKEKFQKLPEDDHDDDELDEIQSSEDVDNDNVELLEAYQEHIDWLIDHATTIRDRELYHELDAKQLKKLQQRLRTFIKRQNQ
ncbi:MAG: hypothetical protein SWH61_05225 [Thermodesulfobacteriota bacterium]|nr:hypothetical protein [Thermodesulfobacteriota bacterium]